MGPSDEDGADVMSWTPEVGCDVEIGAGDAGPAVRGGVGPYKSTWGANVGIKLAL